MRKIFGGENCLIEGFVSSYIWWEPIIFFEDLALRSGSLMLLEVL